MKDRITNEDQLPLIMTADDVADALGICRTKVYEVMHSKDFPALRLGRRMVVPRNLFLVWLEESVVTRI